MKTLAKNFIYAFALSTLFAFNAIADDKDSKKVTSFGTGIYTTKMGRINVSVNKYNQKPTIIMILDQRGQILFKEVVSKNEIKFKRSLDMSQLPVGEYTLQIMSNGEKLIKKLELNERQPEKLISMN